MSADGLLVSPAAGKKVKVRGHTFMSMQELISLSLALDSYVDIPLISL